MDRQGQAPKDHQFAAGGADGTGIVAPAPDGSGYANPTMRATSLSGDGQGQAAAERRQLGAAYLHAYVEQDEAELGRLHEQHELRLLVAGLATAARAMVIHVAGLERASPMVVSAAYRDVWS